MPSIKVELNHTLGKAAAIRSLQSFIEKMKTSHGDSVSNLHETWNDNVLDFGLSTHGMKIEGKMTVEENSVRVDGKIPLLAAMLKGRIENEIRTELEKLLG
jgi:putative polyhydroxyalkanoate system protein